MTTTTADRKHFRIIIVCGFVAGLVLSAVKLVGLLSFFGFWMGGMWPLALTTPTALWISARRQNTAKATLLLATAFVLGLLPGAYLEAARLKAFESEFTFPLLIGAALAISIAPLLFRLFVLRGTRVLSDPIS